MEVFLNECIRIKKIYNKKGVTKEVHTSNKE